MLFRAVKQHGIAFFASIISVYSVIRFTVLGVLDNCVVSKGGRTAPSVESSFHSMVKFVKRQSGRTLTIMDRSLKSLKPKGVLGRTCCFGVKSLVVFLFEEEL